ncbi:hypothetical protein GTY54_33900, partial [Streptomyces sp. SID625]|nr:hypothetical protein [Streptomyces sp. SID625]
MLLKRLLTLASAVAVVAVAGTASAVTAEAGTIGSTGTLGSTGTTESRTTNTGTTKTAPTETSTTAPAALTLVTGDRVMVTSVKGRITYTPVGGSRDAGFREIRRPDGDVEVIPATAVPFLGHGLDMSLFDVSALRAYSDTGRIPVRLSFAAGQKPTAPAGVTLTSVSGNTATGYLTSKSATAFGTALRQRNATDATDPLPRGLTSMT